MLYTGAGSRLLDAHLTDMSGSPLAFSGCYACKASYRTKGVNVKGSDHN